MAEKSLARQAVRQVLQQLEPGWRARASQEIAARVMGLAVWREARAIGLFAGRADEVETSAFWGVETPGKALFYPKIEGEALVFLKTGHLSALRAGRWGLLEPEGGEAGAEGALDLVIVPGLAFDASGGRLGRGRGFYDRWLAANPGVPKVGICFERQMIAAVPQEAHDCRMDAVVTEKTLYAR